MTNIRYVKCSIDMIDKLLIFTLQLVNNQTNKLALCCMYNINKWQCIHSLCKTCNSKCQSVFLMHGHIPFPKFVKMSPVNNYTPFLYNYYSGYVITFSPLSLLFPSKWLFPFLSVPTILSALQYAVVVPDMKIVVT